MSDVEPVVCSSLRLVFGKCEYWFINSEGEWELSNLGDISYFQSPDTIRVSKSLFWKNLSTKIYQYDNFNYDGIASVQYEKKISKFKINFNPKKFYDFVLYAKAVEHGIIDEKFNEIDDNLLAVKFEDSKSIMEQYGWNLEFHNLLVSKQWNSELCRRLWNDIVHKNRYIFECLINVFVHEMMHLMWDHVDRMSKSENPGLFNVAADFAINQSLSFPMAIKKKLITQFSEFFWPDAQFYFLHYLTKNNMVIVPKKVQKILKDKKTFLENRSNVDIEKLINFNYNENIHNKNADFYFNVFKEVQQDLKLPSSDMTGSNEVSPIFGHPSKTEENSSKDRDQQIGDDDFEEQLEKIESEKIFRESYENSEDSKKENTRSGGRSEIPYSFALKERMDRVSKVKKNNNWQKEFSKFLLNYLNAKEKDITMTRSSRKRPEIFPGMKAEMGLDVIFVIDTSGSIETEDYKQFIGEIVNISKICDLEKCRIMQCHTKVSSDERNFSLKKIKSIVFTDTGGTRMRSALEKLEREKNKKPVIIFTDGEIDYFTPGEFKFKILLFVTIPGTVLTLTRRGLRVICPKLD